MNGNMEDICLHGWLWARKSTESICISGISHCIRSTCMNLTATQTKKFKMFPSQTKMNKISTRKSKLTVKLNLC